MQLSMFVKAGQDLW